MGCSAGRAMGFQHHHLQPMAGGQGPGAEAPQAAADHDQVRRAL